MDNLSCGNLCPPRFSEVQVAAGGPARFASMVFRFRYDADSHSGNRWFPIGIAPELLSASRRNRYRHPPGIIIGFAPESLSASSGICSDFLKDWIENIHGQKLSYLSRRKYEDTIRLHLAPQLGHLRLKQLQPLTIHQALQRLLKSGLSSGSVRYAHSVLSAALNTAHRWQILKHNPAKAVEPIPVKPKEKTALTEEQAAQLLKALESHRLWALFYLAIYTGLRKGEVLALQWEDIDIPGLRIHVRHSLYREDGVPKLKEPKSRSGRRVVPIPLQLGDVLHMHQARQKVEREWEEDRWEETGFVFTTRRGKPLDGSNVYHIFQELQEAAGLPRVSFHELRHTYGTRLADLGIGPSALKGLMGHSQASLTLNHYTHLLEPGKDDAAKKLGKQIKRMDDAAKKDGKAKKDLAVTLAVKATKKERPKPLTN